MSSSFNVQVSRFSKVPEGELDLFASRSDQGGPYQSLNWLRAVERAYGHRGWIVTAHRDDELCGFLPLVEIITPLRPAKLVSLPFCDYGGPFADDPEVRAALLHEAKALAARKKIRSLELRERGRTVEEECQTSGAVKVSMLLGLPDTSETLFKSFKPKLRSQIRKAEKNGLTAELRFDEEALEKFYEVFSVNMRRLGSPVHSLDFFRELKRAYGDRMVTGLVFNGEAPVAAGIVLTQGREACIPWASTLVEFNRLAPNMLLYWIFLEYACSKNLRQFDFGRSSFGEGTYRFKKQWGAEAHELEWTRYIVTAMNDTFISESPAGASPSHNLALRQWIERIWRRLPIFITNWLGPRLRRYITL